MKTSNLLYKIEYVLLSQLFFVWIRYEDKNQSKKCSKSELNSFNTAFITVAQLLCYDKNNRYTNLEVEPFLETQSNLKTKKQPKLYYTYRLTFQKPGSEKKQYYMGYKGCTTHPLLDQYYSSSKLVKALTKKHGLECFTKKILGVYLTEQEALHNEVAYHETLKVDINENFLNQERQTTTAFFYDNSNTIQLPETNKKRSIALLGRNRFTKKGVI